MFKFLSWFWDLTSSLLHWNSFQFLISVSLGFIWESHLKILVLVSSIFLTHYRIVAALLIAGLWAVCVCILFIYKLCPHTLPIQNSYPPSLNYNPAISVWWISFSISQRIFSFLLVLIIYCISAVNLILVLSVILYYIFCFLSFLSCGHVYCIFSDSTCYLQVCIVKFMFCQLFDDDNHVNRHAVDYIFSTEGHLFPVSSLLRRAASRQHTNVKHSRWEDVETTPPSDTRDAFTVTRLYNLTSNVSFFFWSHW